MYVLMIVYVFSYMTKWAVVDGRYPIQTVLLLWRLQMPVDYFWTDLIFVADDNVLYVRVMCNYIPHKKRTIYNMTITKFSCTLSFLIVVSITQTTSKFHKSMRQTICSAGVDGCVSVQAVITCI